MGLRRLPIYLGPWLFWLLCAACTTSALSPSGKTVSARSVVQLRNALADPLVSTVEVLQDIKVTLEEWPANEVIFVTAPRTVTVQSAAKLASQPEKWPLIQFTGLRGRIVLESTNITFARLWIFGLRSISNQAATPGMDLLEARGAPFSFLITEQTIGIALSGTAYDAYVKVPGMLQALKLSRPAALPGETVIMATLAPLCRSASTQHAAYCWPSNHSIIFVDLAREALELSLETAVTPNMTALTSAGYYLYGKNATQVFHHPITADCILSKGYPTCAFQTTTQYVDEGPIPTDSQIHQGQNGSSRRACSTTCIVLACVLGGGGSLILVAGVTLGVAMLRRRRAHAQSMQHGDAKKAFHDLAPHSAPHHEASPGDEAYPAKPGSEAGGVGMQAVAAQAGEPCSATAAGAYVTAADPALPVPVVPLSSHSAAQPEATARATAQLRPPPPHLEVLAEMGSVLSMGASVWSTSPGISAVQGRAQLPRTQNISSTGADGHISTDIRRTGTGLMPSPTSSAAQQLDSKLSRRVAGASGVSKLIHVSLFSANNSRSHSPSAASSIKHTLLTTSATVAKQPPSITSVQGSVELDGMDSAIVSSPANSKRAALTHIAAPSAHPLRHADNDSHLSALTNQPAPKGELDLDQGHEVEVKLLADVGPTTGDGGGVSSGICDGVLGRGRFAVVVRGTIHGQPVAVKLLHPQVHTSIPRPSQAFSDVDGGVTNASSALSATESNSTAPSTPVIGAAGKPALVSTLPSAQQQQQQQQQQQDAAATVEASTATTASSTSHASLQQHSVEALAMKAELQVLSRVRHPNVVSLLGAGRGPAGSTCLVLELMHGNLEQWVHAEEYSPDHANTVGDGTLSHGPASLARGVMSLADVLRVACEVAQGLAYLHPTILHMDLKPSNILLDASGTAKLSDFGIARVLDPTLSRTWYTPGAAATSPGGEELAGAGTSAYQAPEALNPDECHLVGPKSDIWSFGVVLWEMMSGRRPWGGKTALQVAYAVCVEKATLKTSDMFSRWPVLAESALDDNSSCIISDAELDTWVTYILKSMQAEKRKEPRAPANKDAEHLAGSTGDAGNAAGDDGGVQLIGKAAAVGPPHVILGHGDDPREGIDDGHLAQHDKQQMHQQEEEEEEVEVAVQEANKLLAAAGSSSSNYGTVFTVSARAELSAGAADSFVGAAEVAPAPGTRQTKADLSYQLYRRILRVVESCWERDPVLRPDAHMLVKQLSLARRLLDRELVETMLAAKEAGESSEGQQAALSKFLPIGTSNAAAAGH